MELTPAHARSILAAVGMEADGLEPIPSRGVGHDHFRLLGRGMVLRVPVWSQIGLDADRHLDYQAAAFDRAHPSGHTPALVRVVRPGRHLPMGALVVREVVGRPPKSADDFPAIARTLAAIHRCPVPDQTAMAPLEFSVDPVAQLLALVEARAPIFAEGAVPGDSAAILADQITLAQAEVRALPRDIPHPISLIGTDVHPGNFMMIEGGRAVFVDLERMQYGHPAMDLAHATLPTSTRWDPAVAVTLTPREVQVFHEVWRDAVGAELAALATPAVGVLRRLVWLRTLTWMAAWLSGDRRPAAPIPAGVAEHLRRHAETVLSPRELLRMAGELG